MPGGRTVILDGCIPIGAISALFTVKESVLTMKESVVQGSSGAG